MQRLTEGNTCREAAKRFYCYLKVLLLFSTVLGYVMEWNCRKSSHILNSQPYPSVLTSIFCNNVPNMYTFPIRQDPISTDAGLAILHKNHQNIKNRLLSFDALGPFLPHSQMIWVFLEILAFLLGLSNVWCNILSGF